MLTQTIIKGKQKNTPMEMNKTEEQFRPDFSTVDWQNQKRVLYSWDGDLRERAVTGGK